MIDFATFELVEAPAATFPFWDYILVCPGQPNRERVLIGPRTLRAAESKLASMLASSGDTFQNLTERVVPPSE